MSILTKASKETDKTTALNRMSYEGTLEDILHETEQLTEHSEPIDKAFTPTRLVRGILDYAIETGIDGERKYELVSKSLDVCKDIYRERVEAVEENVGDVMKEVKEFEDFNVVQKHDMTSWHAYHHNNLEKTIEDIEYGAQGRPVYLLGLSHGGLPPALNTYAEYTKRGKGMNMYTFRLSASKKRDPEPRLTDYEKDVIQDKAKDNHVVLLDEDLATGKTLLEAETYLVDELGIKQYSTVVYDHSFASWLKRGQTVRSITRK